MQNTELPQIAKERALLEVRDLHVSFKTAEGIVTAVNNLNFKLNHAETLAIVGESGSGKSQTAFALLGLLAANARTSGSAKLNGQEILNLPTQQINQLRATTLSIIFQDPMNSLNPYLTIGKQLIEVLKIHKKMDHHTAFNAALNMLDAVKIPDAKYRMTCYPHQCSGGMQQRIMIAMALLCQPKILIADEPTTALDVTVQLEILTLLNELQHEFHTAIILITHDLGIVAHHANKMLVMYAGQTMEYGEVAEILKHPSHPYTIGLLQAVPCLDKTQQQLIPIPGNPPNLLYLPAGCPFQPRCQFAQPICHTPTTLATTTTGRLNACHVAIKEPLC